MSNIIVSMTDEVWEFPPSDSPRTFRVLSLLRDNECPYIGRPNIRAYDADNKMNENDKDADTDGNHKSTASLVRLLLSYPSSTKRMTLHQYLQLKVSRQSELKVLLAYQLMQAIAHLHNCGVSHQFLSSDSVAVELEHEPTIKVTGFYGCTTSPNCSSSYICVRNYRPPEVVLQLSGINPTTVDSWALGCLLFEIFTGSAAFSLERADGNFRPQLIKQQLEETVKGVGKLGENSIPPRCPERVAQFLLSLDHDSFIITRMREVGPAKEAELWISLIQPLLHFNFKQRASVKEMLQHEIFTDLPPPSSWSTSYAVPTRLEELLD